MFTPKNILLIVVSTLLLHTKSPADIITDGTVGQAMTLTGPDFRISDTLGQQVGGNLFHSFKLFDINAGERATFTGPTSVANILARVTGGNASFIDGTLRSEIPNANLYLLNPSGILFGKNANLDISGSFHASTADYLRLGGNGLLDARHPNNSVLTVAPPEAFGFLDNPAPISIQKSFLRVDDGKTLSVLGGDLQIEDSILYAPNGQINLVAVNSTGEVIPTLSDLAVVSFEKLGTITLSQQSSATLRQVGIANIDVSGTSGGRIFIRAGQFFSEKGWVFAATKGNKKAGVDVFIDGKMHLINGTRISANNHGNGQGGDITIRTKTLLVSGLNTEFANPFFQVSAITTNNLNSGTGGNIQITTSSLEMNPGLIQAATAGSGNAGNIHVEAQQVVLRNLTNIENLPTNIGVDTRASGNAGNLTINATDFISLSNDSLISAGASTEKSSGNAGNIVLDTKNMTLKNQGFIINLSEGSGDAGLIKITTDTASLTHKSGITTQSLHAGGGNINLSVRESLYLNESRITAEAQGIESHHHGGNLFIRKPQFLILNNSRLLANAYAGNGGNIRITTEYFIQSSDSRLDASSQLGIDGKIEIESLDDDFSEKFTVLPSTFSDATLPTRCAARSGTNLSRFIVTGPEILPESPHALSVHIPSQLLDSLNDKPNNESNTSALNSQISRLFMGCRRHSNWSPNL
jgi:filamentous hemagglutinin family protein